jgi:hypothetical protein
VQALFGNTQPDCEGVGNHCSRHGGVAAVSQPEPITDSYVWQYELTDGDQDGIFEAHKVRGVGLNIIIWRLQRRAAIARSPNRCHPPKS